MVPSQGSRPGVSDGLVLDRRGPARPEVMASVEVPEGREFELPIDVQRCVVRHFAVAATELARLPDQSPDESARYAVAEARLRSILQLQGDIRRQRDLACPAVRLGSGESISLVELLIASCPVLQKWPPLRAFDPDLLAAAKDLLRGVDWYVPGS